METFLLTLQVVAKVATNFWPVFVVVALAWLSER